MQKTKPAPFTEGKRHPIELKPVPKESSQIADSGYDEATSTMALRFKHDAKAIYHYPGVTKEEYEAFLAAESHGSHFGKHFKLRSFTKHPPEPVEDKNSGVDHHAV